MSISKFKSDGCTMWPDGNYRDCCVRHDLDAFNGIADNIADIALFQCVAESTNPAWAAIMVIGLFIFRPIYRKIKGWLKPQK